MNCCIKFKKERLFGPVKPFCYTHEVFFEPESNYDNFYASWIGRGCPVAQEENRRAALESRVDAIERRLDRPFAPLSARETEGA